MVLDRHTPIKSKKIKRNHTPFMSKQLSKAIINRSKLRNRYIKWPSRENLTFRKQKNFCNNLSRKIKKRNCFTQVGSKGVTGNKDFWNAVKPFLTCKGFLHNDDWAINFGNRTITGDKELSKIFSEYYINILQNTTGTAPVKISSKYELNIDQLVVEEIINIYGNHSSIKYN